MTPLLGDQWQYYNPADHDIDAYDPDPAAQGAWDLVLGSGVAVAVLDTGIDQSHEDLVSKILASKNFTSSKTVDDRYGHGTHVAGSVAASMGNGKGVAGTCPGCGLLNVKVLGDNGSGY